MQGKRIPTDERFWSKVDKSGDCWLWTGSGKPRGYGQFWHRGTNVRAHRYAYEITAGAIPDGMQLDHLCRTPACVNPAHLEVVTQQENIARATVLRTTCPLGHEYTGRGPDGARYCHACKRLADAKRYAKRVAARPG